MNIKISSLRSILHERESFSKDNESFLCEIEKRLNEKLIVSPLNDYDCDLKLIFIESGGAEGLFLNHLNELKAPYYLLTSGNNNSLAASIEILTYLNINKLNGEIIHGDYNYIVKRIKELAVAKTSRLEKRRLGVIGKPSDWLISSIPNYQLINDKFNYELIDISIDTLIDYYNKVDIKDYKEELELKFDDNELNKAKRVYLAINKIKEEYHLDGLTIRCFDLLDSIKTTSCLGLALLNINGIIGTCEGDIMSMVTMQLIKDITNQSSFQANPSRINVNTNEVVLAHCTIPFDMLDSYYLMSHFESNSGVAIKGKLFEQDVTILRLSSNLKDYFISEGTIINNLNETNLCRTQITVKFDENVDRLLKTPCGNHHIVFYGRHKDELEKVLKEIY